VGKKYSEVAFSAGLVTSKSEAVRLIKNNGAYLNNRKIEDVNFQIEASDIIQNSYVMLAAGKKKKILVKIVK
jgi:tyrosyl-tRNA synthetase